MLNKLYTRLLPSLSIGMAVAILWDAWWHVEVGRDQFWIPPHDLLYICLAFTFLISFIAWRKTKIREFKAIFFLSFLIPFSGVFDEIWHSIFGTEVLTSPLVVWSPPHMVLLGSVIALIVFMRKIVKLDIDPIVRWFLDTALLSAILGFLLIVVMPFYPLSSYHVVGFWGAGMIAFVWVGAILYTQRNMPQAGTAILLSCLFGLLATFGPPTAIEPAEGVIVGDFHNPPMWLFLFSFVVPAIVAEYIRNWNSIIKGIVLGFISGAILYTSARYFVDVPNLYGMNEIIIAVISCIVGGFVAGAISLIKKNK